MGVLYSFLREGGYLTPRALPKDRRLSSGIIFLIPIVRIENKVFFSIFNNSFGYFCRFSFKEDKFGTVFAYSVNVLD